MITDSVSILVIRRFGFSIFSWVTLLRFHVAKNLSILYGIWLLAYNVHIIFFWTFLFLWHELSFFWFYFWNFSFFLNLDRGLSILFIISKDQLLVFWYFLLFFHLLSFYSWSILCYVLFATLSFLCSSFSSLRCEVSLLIWGLFDVFVCSYTFTSFLHFHWMR